MARRKRPSRALSTALSRLFAPLPNQAALAQRQAEEAMELAQQQAEEAAELVRRQVEGEAARMIVEELSPSHDRPCASS